MTKTCIVTKLRRLHVIQQLAVWHLIRRFLVRLLVWPFGKWTFLNWVWLLHGAPDLVSLLCYAHFQIVQLVLVFKKNRYRIKSLFLNFCIYFLWFWYNNNTVIFSTLSLLDFIPAFDCVLGNILLDVVYLLVPAVRFLAAVNLYNVKIPKGICSRSN